MIVLGLETTCDETAAGIVRRSPDGSGEILANEILSQIAAHAEFGGVVPEIAARAHIEVLERLIRRALEKAKAAVSDLDCIAAATGPGLIGGLLVGATMAKAMAMASGKPFVAVNHLEAHALTPRLTDGVNFPYLLLLVSGGHTQIAAVHAPGDYTRLGTTLDDALGEAFDKIGKLLGLPYPGGPSVEREAERGDPEAFKFPRPMAGRLEPDFSLSGLKTAVRLAAERLQPLSETDVANICASFQAAVIDVVIDRLRAGLRAFAARVKARPTCIVIAGGVAANQALRGGLRRFSAETGMKLIAPPPALCTDNGAMIAWAAAEKFAAGLTDPLDSPARARWPLDTRAVPVVGHGKLGVKV